MRCNRNSNEDMQAEKQPKKKGSLTAPALDTEQIHNSTFLKVLNSRSGKEITLSFLSKYMTTIVNTDWAIASALKEGNLNHRKTGFRNTSVDELIWERHGKFAENRLQNMLREQANL
jgi:hypothetical protein